MKYTEFIFQPSPSNDTVKEILMALLSEIGFESFMDSEEGMAAYIPTESLRLNEVQEMVSQFPISDASIDYSYREMEDKNWNEEWEKNFFKPIVIGNRCVIHSTFHEEVPQAEYNIIINPQMAFGTGHHETTSLIVEILLESELRNKSVLDMGCGTSILAILARMRGAQPITAIDIDSWCVENSKENITLNRVSDISVELGDAASLFGKGPFDLVIANINRNILLNDMKYYVACMKPGSELIMSGFYTEDITLIEEEAVKLGLKYDFHHTKNNWAAVKFSL